MFETEVEILVRFSRLATEARSPEAILDVLSSSARDYLGAGAAAILKVGEGERLTVVAGAGLPAELAGWQTDVDLIGPELAGAALAACAGRFARAETMVMVSGGDLFGVLVLFMDQPAAPQQRMLAEALADLAATALGKALQFAQLQRTNTELRASREALARSEKLRALGQMAAGIAHDIKNILNPLGLQIEVLRRRLARDPATADEVLANMTDAIQTGVATVERLRSFSRQEPERQIEPADLNEIVASALEISRPQLDLRSGIQLRHELGQLPPVLAHGPELVTAIVNLLVNALDALGDEGTITVATGAADGGAWLSVADDGPGMAPEIEQRVFEPFFTTKGDKGTGLGLAMVYALVLRSAGRVTLTTAPGQGARFQLWFPAHR